MTIEVRSLGGPYPVRILSVADAVARLPERAYCITDSNVAAAWGHAMPDSVPICAVTPGEASKSIESFGRCHSWLAGVGAGRDAMVLAFGGGVVGDLAGFVAATYMRGVPSVQMPTSLLAMVDSSVGGKVGLDLPEGKNLVGAFSPPQEVWICPETLATLPERQLRNGMAEVWKYAFLGNPALRSALEAAPLDWEAVIAACVRQKAEIVEEDEFDRTGRRATLNFGHTIGHALETLTGYEGLLHGEAVAIGMAIEARIGEAIGFTRPGVVQEIEELLTRSGLPIRHDALRRSEEILALVRRDKKASAEGLGFSLLARMGECRLVSDVPETAIRAILEAA